MGAAQSDNRRSGNDFGGKGRRNERGDRGQDRFRGQRNGERRQRKFNDKNDRLLMNVIAEIANINPYLTAPEVKGLFIALILVTILSYLNFIRFIY